MPKISIVQDKRSEIPKIEKKNELQSDIRIE